MKKLSIPSSQKLVKLVLEFPVPSYLSYLWNFGSLMGWCLVMQIVSGLMLVMYYTPSVSDAFSSVVYIMRDVEYGWLIRGCHANGASMFFICVYIHTGRGLFYESYKLGSVWSCGVTMLVLLMAIAFTGYVLPWGQMSFWGATVITNLFTVIPKFGVKIVNLMWGANHICGATLKRFFVLHFLMPFVLVLLMLVHLGLLHETGSSNVLGVDSSCDLVPFYPYYFYKDLLGISVYMMVLMSVCLLFPDLFGDPENFLLANPSETPKHIQPEWYFLFAYSILRSTPTKLGGVVALAASVLVLYTLPMFSSISKGFISGFQFNPISKFYFWLFVSNFVFLSYTGACPVEYPFIDFGKYSTCFYFLYFYSYPIPKLFWEKLVSLL
ncbi:cytochrome b (mitochondrion) [Mya arenaria]|nr:cytochrome b [Mya arenaria]AII72395.2 cytochrome b [Mya arenaria]